MARVVSAYWPGSSRVAGKLKRPSCCVATLTVTVEPARFALTTTPSIGPSLADDTVPVSAAGDWLCARLLVAGHTDKVKASAAVANNNVLLSIAISVGKIFQRPFRLFNAPPADGKPPAGHVTTSVQGLE